MYVLMFLPGKRNSKISHTSTFSAGTLRFLAKITFMQFSCCTSIWLAGAEALKFLEPWCYGLWTDH